MNRFGKRSEEETQTPSKKVFLGGLSNEIDEKVIEEAFSKFGKVTDVLIIKDKTSGVSKGFGFISFENHEEANKAVQSMHQKTVLGRTLTVQIARSEQEKGELQKRRSSETRRSPPVRRDSRDQIRSRSRSRERREPRPRIWDRDNREESGRGRWGPERSSDDLRYQIREAEMARYQIRGEEGDPWARSERQYSGRPQGDVSGFDRGGPRGRRHTRWDPTEDNRGRSQMAADSAREMNEFYGRGQDEPRSSYYDNQMESERQREFGSQNDPAWSRNPTRRQQDSFYGMERQQLTEPMSSYRPNNEQFMRHESSRSAYRVEEERLPPRLDRDRMPVRSDGDRIPVRSDGERMGVGMNSERLGMGEWIGGRSESQRMGTRADRMGVSERQGMPERGPDRMGGTDRLGGRMTRPDQGRMEGYERYERSGMPERGSSLQDRRGGSDKVSPEWPGGWSESDMARRSENERHRMREDSSRWSSSWHQEDTDRRSETGRMGVQPDRRPAGMPIDNRAGGREREWGGQPPPRDTHPHYYNQGRTEQSRGTTDSYKPLFPPSTSRQSRWESHNSVRVSGSQYDPYSQQRDTYPEEPSRYPQQSDSYRSSRVPDNITQSRGGHLASQSYPPSQSDQARRQSREYESYSPTKPQMYEGDDYPQGPSHYSADRRSHDPQSHRSSQAYSTKSFDSQKQPSSSQFQDPKSYEESSNRRLSQGSLLSYSRDYQSDYPRDSLQNPHYSYSHSQSRSNPSGYNQPSSEWKDTHPDPHSSSTKPSYDETEAPKANQTHTPSLFASSKPTHSDPQSTEPASGTASVETSGSLTSDPSAHSNSDPSASNRVYVTSSPTLFPMRPVTPLANVQLCPPVYGGYPRQPLLIRPQVGLPGIRGLAAQVFPFASGNRPVRPQ